MSTITPQSLSLLDSAGQSAPSKSVDTLLPAGSSLQATVKQVSQDQLTPHIYRVKVDAQNSLLEIRVAQSIPQGTPVTLSRDTNGQLSLTINNQPATATSAQTSQTPSSASLAPAQVTNSAQTPTGIRTYQAPVTPVINSQADATLLNQLIPRGQLVAATVLQQIDPKFFQPAQPAQPAQQLSISPSSPTATNSAGTQVPNNVSGYVDIKPTQLLTLNIQNQQVQVKAPANLPPLTNVHLGRGLQDNFSVRWSQEVQLTTSQAHTALNTEQKLAIENSLRTTIPRQVPIAEGVNQLLTGAQQANIGSTTANVDKVVQSLLQLFGVQPGSSDAPQVIKQNIQLGGLFTESRLAQGQTPTNDMKQFLGKLDALSEHLPQGQKILVRDAVDKMMARITTQQLTQVQHKQDRVDNNERFIQLDLPVKYQDGVDNVELRINQRHQKSKRGEMETIWTVRLHFDLDSADTIDSDISLNEAQNTLSASFSCSKSDTLARLRDKLDQFETQVADLGLTISSLACREGSLKAHTPLQKQLIDVKT